MHLVTENELLQTVLEMAEALGYVVYHVLEQSHYAKRTAKGFPDLVMCRDQDLDRGRDARMIVMELKSQLGKVSDDQLRWLDYFRQFGIENYLIRPSDLDNLENLLR